MRSVDDDNESRGSKAPWLPELRQPTVQHVDKETSNPHRYTLVERSFIETELNQIFAQYNIPLEQFSEIDELVYNYVSAVEALFIAVQRWEERRGEEKLDLHTLLFLEKGDLETLSTYISTVIVANSALRRVVQSFERSDRRSVTSFYRLVTKYLFPRP